MREMKGISVILNHLCNVFLLVFFSVKGMYKTGDTKSFSAVISNVQN